MQGYDARFAEQDILPDNSDTSGLSSGVDLQDGQELSDESLIKSIIFACYARQVGL